MINVYLRKLTATNDVFLNDPTKFAVPAVVITEAPQSVAGGAGQVGQAQADALELRDLILVEDEEIMTIITALIELEGQEWHLSLTA